MRHYFNIHSNFARKYSWKLQESANPPRYWQHFEIFSYGQITFVMQVATLREKGNVQVRTNLRKWNLRIFSRLTDKIYFPLYSFFYLEIFRAFIHIRTLRQKGKMYFQDARATRRTRCAYMYVVSKLSSEYANENQDVGKWIYFIDVKLQSTEIKINKINFHQLSI